MSPSKLIFTAAMLILFLVAPFACTQAIAMANAHGSMDPCPLTNGTSSLCNMNVMQHIDAWESLFTATAPAITLLFLVLAFSLILFASSNFLENNSPGTAFSIFKDRLGLSFLDPLRWAFSRGILHSKRHVLSFSF